MDSEKKIEEIETSDSEQKELRGNTGKTLECAMEADSGKAALRRFLAYYRMCRNN